MSGRLHACAVSGRWVGHLAAGTFGYRKPEFIGQAWR